MARLLGKALRETGMALDRLGSSLQGNYAFREECESRAHRVTECRVPEAHRVPPARSGSAQISPLLPHCSESAQDAGPAAGQDALTLQGRLGGAQRLCDGRCEARRQRVGILRQRDQGCVQRVPAVAAAATSTACLPACLPLQSSPPTRITHRPHRETHAPALRAADSGSITIGDRSNVQDGCVIRTASAYLGGHARDTVIGSRVTVGHQASLHGCTIEDSCLIGMNSSLLEGCTVRRVLGGGGPR